MRHGRGLRFAWAGGGACPTVCLPHGVGTPCQGQGGIVRGQECPRQCAREGALSEGWKSPPGHTLSGPETDCNCVAEMRGGEQREVNHRSVG